ncbi:hypothetical protein CYMTET_41152 [Cymbomonas tetramitiformis]|uniref:Replication factor-A protein 1 N-terminal domain-containing protein n=1 Tax=Cymbomonas tetramitiformis TaxID=36881 RepID=A0AAE0C8U1_9CHLO|nr:hypothetical protein CYMTET_41152 [Cymbomonas tetramitiformis]
MSGGYCSVPLSTGAIPNILEGGTPLSPVLQCINIKQIGSTGGSAAERFRLVLSDGHHWGQAMLATQLNHLVTTEQVKEGTVMRLQEYICNVVQGRKIVITLNIEPLGTREKEGDPKTYTPCGGNNSAPKNNGGFPTMTKETPDRVPMKVAMEVGHLEDMVGMVAFKAAKPVVVKEEAVVEKAEEAVITEETVVEKVGEVVVILEQEVVEVGRVVADMADTVTVVVRQEKEPTVEEVEVMVAEMLLAVVMGLEVIVAATPIDNHSSQLLATTPVVPALSRATRPRCVLFP